MSKRESKSCRYLLSFLNRNNDALTRSKSEATTSNHNLSFSFIRYTMHYIMTSSVRLVQVLSMPKLSADTSMKKSDK